MFKRALRLIKRKKEQYSPLQQGDETEQKDEKGQLEPSNRDNTSTASLTLADNNNHYSQNHGHHDEITRRSSNSEEVSSIKVDSDSGNTDLSNSNNDRNKSGVDTSGTKQLQKQEQQTTEPNQETRTNGHHKYIHEEKDQKIHQLPSDSEKTTLLSDQNEQRGIIKPFYVLLRDFPLFTYLWAGSGISQFGDLFNYIATAEVITAFTDSTWALSLYLICAGIPTVLFSPIAGAFADRYDRRFLMIFSDISRAVIVLGLLLIRTKAMLWLLYVLVFSLYVFESLFYPARSALLPIVIGPERISLANTLMSTTYSVTNAMGGAAGGFIASILSTDMCYILDALSFVASALCVLLILKHWNKYVKTEPNSTPTVVIATNTTDEKDNARSEAAVDNTNLVQDRATRDQGIELKEMGQNGAHPDKVVASETSVLDESQETQPLNPVNENKQPANVQSESNWAMFKSGMYYLYSHDDLLWLTWYKSIGNISMGAIDVINIRTATRIFADQGGSKEEIQHESSLYLGILWLCVGIGSMSPFLLRIIDRKDTSTTRRQSIGVALIIVAISGLFITFAESPLLFYLGNLFWNSGESIIYVQVTTGLQLGSEDAFRGRVFAFAMMVRVGSHIFGTMAIATLIDSVGLNTHTATMCVTILQSINAFSWFVWYYPRWKRYYKDKEVAVQQA